MSSNEMASAILSPITESVQAAESQSVCTTPRSMADSPATETINHKLVALAGVIFVLFLCGLAGTLVAIYRRPIRKDGKTGIFLPLFVYDFAVTLHFPMNFLVSSLMYLQPTHSEWNNPNNFIFVGPEALKQKSGEDLGIMRKDILEETDRMFAEVDLVRLFDSLPPASPGTLLGKAWEGRILRTNKHLLDVIQVLVARLLKTVGVSWGRRIVSHHRGDPLVLNIANKLYVPIPLWGNISTETCVWRGVSTACGRFNNLPWTDMYRILEDYGKTQVILACWTNREKTGGWYTLRLDKTWPMTSTAPFA